MEEIGAPRSPRLAEWLETTSTCDNLPIYRRCSESEIKWTMASALRGIFGKAAESEFLLRSSEIERLSMLKDGCRSTKGTDDDHSLREVCLCLHRPADAVGVGVGGEGGARIVVDIPTDKLTKGSIGKGAPTSNTNRPHKMNYEDNQTPPPAENNHQREAAMEARTDFAFMLVISCYALLYSIYSTVVGREGDRRLMMGLHVWTIILVLLLIICSFIRLSVRSLKIVRLVMAGLLSVSGCVVFVLLQLTL